jgi:hypothetical protein
VDGCIELSVTGPVSRSLDVTNTIVGHILAGLLGKQLEPAGAKILAGGSASVNTMWLP